MAVKKNNTAEKDNEQVSEKNSTLKAVEEWAKIKNTDPVIYAGILLYAGWRKGKYITEEQYDNAVTSFVEGAADGRDS